MVKKVYGMLIINFLILLFLIACQTSFKEINVESDKILFISSKNEQLELYMTNSNGDNISKVMNTNKQVTDVAISPNLRYIILREAKMNNNNLEADGLYIYDREKKRRKLIEEKGLYPSWSPDGEKFVYIKRTDDFKEVIVLADPQLVNKEVLIDLKYSLSGGISWSPDGSELLLYNSYLYQDIQDINVLYRYIVAEDELKQIKLKNTYNLYNAAWSPVERIIAAGIYDSELKKYTLALIEPDTGNVTHLTTVENNLYLELEWSPDGKNILFTAYEVPLLNFRGTWPWSNDSTDIFVYDIENDEIRNLTKSDSTDYRPQWIP